MSRAEVVKLAQIVDNVELVNRHQATRQGKLLQTRHIYIYYAIEQ